MKISKIFISAIVLLLSTSVFGQTQVPNTFQSGQPARAAEVNANFSELENAVNQNADDISTNTAAISANTAAIQGTGSPRVFDGGDNEIGSLVSINDNRLTFAIITQQGYLFTMWPRDGMILGTGTAISFASSDCTGTGYMANAFGGYVASSFDSTGAPSLYYIDKNSLPVTNFSIASFIADASGCIVTAGQLEWAFPVVPNDPTVTGVSNDSYQPPIKIQSPQ